VNHQAAITQVLFSPDSAILVTGDLRGSIFCWDLTLSPPQGTLIGKKAMIMQFGFSPDGKILVAGDKEGALIYWHMTKPLSTESKPLVGHRGSISSFSFDPKSNFLVSADTQKGLYYWDLTQPTPTCESLKGLQANARQFTVTPNGQHLVAIDGKGSFLYWNISSGDRSALDIFTLQTWFPKPHKNQPKTLFQISPQNPNNLLVTSHPGTLLQTLYLPHPICDWTVSEDEQILMICADTMVFCWLYDMTRKSYMLQWIDGDALICQGAILNEVKDLSEANIHVFNQLGASKVISANVAAEQKLSSEPVPLSEKEISIIEQQLAKNAAKKAELKLQIMEINQEEKKLKQKLDSHYQFLMSVKKSQKNTNL
jgi:WD40 repeat protein